MGENLHTFRGASLEEAYREMRLQLGADAVVVRTQRVKDGGLWGFLGKSLVEVTASGRMPGEAARRPLSAVERKYVATAPTTPTPSKVARDVPVDQLAYFEEIIRGAQARMGGDRSGAAPAPLDRGRASLSSNVGGGAAPELAAAPRAGSVVPFRKPESLAPPRDNLRDELREMRSMIEVLYAEHPGAALPPELAPHYQALVETGCSRKAAAELVAALSRECATQAPPNAVIVADLLYDEVHKRVRVTGGLAIVPGQCRVVALTGPTGVGKTTTLAKLAAHFAVHQETRVALITMDTYRVAAPEQLRTYADIIGLPMRVANDAKEMIAALRAFRDHELVLIDTAGTSPFNGGQLQESKELLGAARPDEVLLLAAANTPLEDLRHAVANFRCLAPTALVFTKLDETRRYGAMYSLLMECGLPLSYLSAGQNVPDDIVLAQPGTVADMILGGKDGLR